MGSAKKIMNVAGAASLMSLVGGCDCSMCQTSAADTDELRYINGTVVGEFKRSCQNPNKRSNDDTHYFNIIEKENGERFAVHRGADKDDLYDAGEKRIFAVSENTNSTHSNNTQVQEANSKSQDLQGQELQNQYIQKAKDSNSNFQQDMSQTPEELVASCFDDVKPDDEIVDIIIYDTVSMRVKQIKDSQ